jgi:uncharacterized damage-inducible protein DinB
MSSEFERDLEVCREDIEGARATLLDVLGGLSDADLEASRRGGWTVRRVLEHVIWSELLYGRLVTHLRGLPVPPGDLPPCEPASVADAGARLDASRAALLAALDGVDEVAFYRLGTIGHEEYSVLSLLENTANHDREHTAQVQAIASG